MAAPLNLADIRQVYQKQSLLEGTVDSNPLDQFKHWWDEVIQSGIDEPNAMNLSTCSIEGRPSSRIVLLKEVNENGFIFFTNYNSRKGKEMEQNNFVSILFFWKELERQVRVEGKVEKIPTKKSDEYFASRPRESQVGAWSSPQSEVIESRSILEKNEKQYSDQFQNKNIERPQHWGGYLVIPRLIEFWQGRPGRLHDRLRYSLSEKQWVIERLAP